MLMLKIAFRNIFRNTRRSMTTLSTIAVGAAAVSVFGAYTTYIQYGVQTNAVPAHRASPGLSQRVLHTGHSRPG
jgi:hypothetical protein